MTDTTQKLITQLRTLQQLTNTEAQARLRPGSGCSRAASLSPTYECPHGVPSAGESRIRVYQSYIDWQETAALHEVGRHRVPVRRWGRDRPMVLSS